MLLGMLGQIFCGNLTGLVDTYQLHIYFRCITSVCCTIMYTAGHAICKIRYIIVYKPAPHSRSLPP